jgi:hypothetical protein
MIHVRFPFLPPVPQLDLAAMTRHRPKTKIVCTLGLTSCSVEMISRSGARKERHEHGQNKGGTFVKINMDDVSIGRKVDLAAYGGYAELSAAVGKLFRGLLAGTSATSSLAALKNSLVWLLCSSFHHAEISTLHIPEESYRGGSALRRRPGGGGAGDRRWRR